MKNKATGIKRVVNAFGYSCKGLRSAFSHEAAFRQEVYLFIIAVIISAFLPVTMFQRLFLIGSVVLVIIVELLNSAVENVVDRIGDEYHELSGRAKDIGSAAVLVSLCLAAFTWIVILFFT